MKKKEFEKKYPIVVFFVNSFSFSFFSFLWGCKNSFDYY